MFDGDDYPRRHHYIPLMLLRRFETTNGKIFYYNRRFKKKKILETTPENIFLQNNLHTVIQRDGSKDLSLEINLSEMESAASDIISKIINNARDGYAVKLNQTEKEIWDAFFFTQWKRTPDFHEKIYIDDEIDLWLEEWRKEHETSEGPLTPEQERDYNNQLWRKRIRQNLKIEALAGDNPSVQKILRQKGLGIMRINKANKSFVMGSFPVIKLAHSNRSHISDPTVEMWLPIAPDIAISPAPCRPEETILVEVNDDSCIRAINSNIYKQSSAIAARSDKLIASLIGGIDT